LKRDECLFNIVTSHKNRMGGFPGGAGRCRGTAMTRSWSTTSRALSWTARQADSGHFGVRDAVELQDADVEVRMNGDSLEFE
jgi:hypothetical protein